MTQWRIERIFGLTWSIIFFGLSVIMFSRSDVLFAAITTILGVLLFVISWIRPKFLFKPNKIWNRIGFVLGRVSNPILLATVFFIVLSPISMCLRLFGRDELEISNERRIKTSYWKTRNHEEFDFAFFKRQY